METKKNVLSSLGARNMKTYIQEDYLDDLKRYTESCVKTGFGSIDAKTKLYPGLYVLGAVSSLGKTTFCFQLAVNLAVQGKSVIFITLEENCQSLSSKLNRLLWSTEIANNPNDPTDATQDLEPGEIRYFVSNVPEYIDKITIVPADSGIYVGDILSYIDTWMESTNEKPVVIIDYLQLICGDRQASAKDNIDSTVKSLANYRKKHDLIMILISSLNRNSYMSLLSFESFKESGGIEYSADVVLGLQYQVLHDSLFDLNGKINEKREKLMEAKAENPRRLELVCLKNRGGNPVFSSNLEFYAGESRFQSEGQRDIQILPDLMPTPEGPTREHIMSVLQEMEILEPEFF